MYPGPEESLFRPRSCFLWSQQSKGINGTDARTFDDHQSLITADRQDLDDLVRRHRHLQSDLMELLQAKGGPSLLKELTLQKGQLSQRVNMTLGSQLASSSTLAPSENLGQTGVTSGHVRSPGLQGDLR